MIVFAQVCSVPEAWSLLRDPGGLCTVSLSAPAVVTYSTGGSDTVPANTPSPDSPVDTTADVWCPYIVPGDGTLRLTKEADIATLAAGADVAIMGRIMNHEVVPFQVATSAT